MAGFLAPPQNFWFIFLPGIGGVGCVGKGVGWAAPNQLKNFSKTHWFLCFSIIQFTISKVFFVPLLYMCASKQNIFGRHLKNIKKK